MKTPIHRRALAAMLLLAFAITFVVAALLALASPDQTNTAPLATVAVVAVIASAAVIVMAKKAHETFVQTAVELISMAAAAIVMALGIVPKNRTALADIDNDIGTFWDPRQTINQPKTLHRRRGSTHARNQHGNSAISMTADGRTVIQT